MLSPRAYQLIGMAAWHGGKVYARRRAPDYAGPARLAAAIIVGAVVIGAIAVVGSNLRESDPLTTI
ncbi:MAG: hypothetical protein KGR19_09235 [Acidobacteria bacterium]|nr:hypothetical protein [Acidobacteriota bacterium]